MEPDAVVRASRAAQRKRKAICVPGRLNNLAMFQMRFTPRWIMRKLAKLQLGRFEKLRLKTCEPNNSHAVPGAAPSPRSNAATIAPSQSVAATPSGDAAPSVHATSLEAVP
jgi:hypothetical protein